MAGTPIEKLKIPKNYSKAIRKFLKVSKEKTAALRITNSETAYARYNICKNCAQFRKITRQCKICDCLMFIKTKFETANCPIGKW